jgi:uncharacterized protein
MSQLTVSKYNLCFQSSKMQEQKFYVYNTFSTSLLQVDEKTHHSLNQGLIPELTNDLIKLLQDKGFLVNRHTNEAAEYLYYYNRTRFGESSATLKIVVIPTYLCNLSCAYCLQGKGEELVEKKRLPDRMDENGAEKILKFIENKIVNSSSTIPVRKVHLSFHGGEPLYAFRVCEYIAHKLKTLTNLYGIEFSSTMATNLTLLNQKIIDFIRAHDISVQVTIDGNKGQHDSRRFYNNKTGTYDLITKNLNLLVNQGLKKNVVIRLNIDSETIKNAAETMAEVRQFSDDIYFAALCTFSGKNDSYSSMCIDSSCSATQESKLAEIYKYNGLEVPSSFGKKGPCSLNCENKFYIDPSLNVYKCEILIDQPEYSVGTINDSGEITYSPEFYRQMNWGPDRFQKCLDCVILPCCAGGCPATGKDSQNGNIMNASCQYSRESLIEHLKNYVIEG